MWRGWLLRNAALHKPLPRHVWLLLPLLLRVYCHFLLLFLLQLHHNFLLPPLLLPLLPPACAALPVCVPVGLYDAGCNTPCDGFELRGSQGSTS